MYSDKYLVSAHHHSRENKQELQKKEQPCGCFYCQSIFSSTEIVDYIDWMEQEPEGSIGFALCPRCGIDAVIGEYSGYPITIEFLKKMFHHWFE